ncbi:MAG TPA: FAD-dependent oxidoreductase, partial [Sphingobacteriaceae bacterium]
VLGQGVLVLNNSKVNDIQQTENGATLETNHARIKARKTIVATNAFATEFFPELDMVPGRGQVLITEPIHGLPVKGTFHYDKGYYYFRNIHDRILLGGGRNLDFQGEETQIFGITDPIQNRLQQLLHDIILPNRQVRIEQRWSGIMAFGDTLTPIIREIRENVFCAVRCNGMGIAMGSQVGEHVGDMVLKALD